MGRWWGLSTGSVQRLDLVMDEIEKGKWGGIVGEEGRASPTSEPMQYCCEVEELERRGGLWHYLFDVHGGC